jgi:hypothetical protein
MLGGGYFSAVTHDSHQTTNWAPLHPFNRPSLTLQSSRGPHISPPTREALQIRSATGHMDMRQHMAMTQLSRRHDNTSNYEKQRNTTDLFSVRICECFWCSMAPL